MTPTQTDFTRSGEGFGGLMAGTHTLLVGLEDNGDDGLRVYLKSRSEGLYALVYDEAAKANLLRVWGGYGPGHGSGHITVPIPPSDCIYQESNPS
jgi:hypothetical protein